MGEDQIEKLRRRLAKTSGRGRGGYGAELRQQGAALARKWVARGGSRRRLAEKLGISRMTVTNWIKEHGEDAAPVRAVEVIDRNREREDGVLVAKLPYGVRIEGLTVADVAELARRLP